VIALMISTSAAAGYYPDLFGRSFSQQTLK